MHHPTDRIIHTTAFVTPVVEHWLEREIAQWVHPMKDRSDDPSHHENFFLIPTHLNKKNHTGTKQHFHSLLLSVSIFIYLFLNNANGHISAVE